MKNIQYIGLDVHKENIAISLFINNRKEPEIEKQIKNTKKSILSFFNKRKEIGDIISCYEAGCLGFEIYRLLESVGIKCLVVAPGQIPRKPGDKIKTDRRDARTLARLLKSGELDSIYIPTEEDEATRDFIRMRDDLRKSLMRCRHQLLKFLLRHGVKFDEGKQHWTGKHYQWLSKQKFDQELLQLTFDTYLYNVKDIEERIRRIDEKIFEISSSQKYKERVAKLRCLKGIDYYSAMALLCEIGDFKRFPSANAFMSFLGLVPKEYSSGNTRRLGGITKAGNGLLRRVLVESSWTFRRKAVPSQYMTRKRINNDEKTICYALKASRRLENKYINLRFKGKHANKVNIAIARELSGFIWGLMTGHVN